MDNDKHNLSKLVLSGLDHGSTENTKEEVEDEREEISRPQSFNEFYNNIRDWVDGIRVWSVLSVGFHIMTIITFVIGYYNGGPGAVRNGAYYNSLMATTVLIFCSSWFIVGVNRIITGRVTLRFSIGTSFIIMCITTFILSFWINGSSVMDRFVVDRHVVAQLFSGQLDSCVTLLVGSVTLAFLYKVVINNKTFRQVFADAFKRKIKGQEIDDPYGPTLNALYSNGKTKSDSRPLHWIRTAGIIGICSVGAYGFGWMLATVVVISIYILFRVVTFPSTSRSD